MFIDCEILNLSIIIKFKAKVFNKFNNYYFYVESSFTGGWSLIGLVTLHFLNGKGENLPFKYENRSTLLKCEKN